LARDNHISGPPGETFITKPKGERTFAPEGVDGEVGLRLAEGSVVGGIYTIVAPIGQGGMGVVYLSMHQTLAKRCAIKLIPPDQVTETSWQRFQLEAKSVARLNHKNIVKVTDLGLHKGYLPFYAMEYVDGQSLAERLESHGPLDWREGLEIFIQICDGVDHAHAAGIIHRDLKPANIMVAGKEVKILDFGLAKLSTHSREDQSLTHAGDIFGSPYYMSPEQCAGEAVDKRSDVYSLGCALFECLTGRPPFNGTISAAVMISQQELPPPTLAAVLGVDKVPASLDLVLAKLLRKKPADRYQSCLEVSADLNQILRGLDLLSVAKVEPVEAISSGQNSTAFGAVIFIGSMILAALLVAYCAFMLKAPPEAKAPVTREWQSSDVAFDKAIMKESVENTFYYFKGGGSKTAPPSVQDKSFYSTAGGATSAAKTRIFNFPTDTMIGYINNDGRRNAPARGRVLLENGPINFDPSTIAVQYPKYFARFRPGEINRLTLHRLSDINACCKAITYMPDWQSLSKLSLRGFDTPLNAASLHTLDSFTKIKNFEFAESSIDPQVIAGLSILQKVPELTLGNLKSYGPILKALSRSPNLTALTFKDAQLTERDWQDIANMPKLEAFRVEGAGLSSDHLKLLARAPRLVCLGIPGKTMHDPQFIKSLKLFPHLKWLELFDVSDSDYAMAGALSGRLPGVQIEPYLKYVFE
jgi:serine/threonine protein kinase